MISFHVPKKFWVQSVTLAALLGPSTLSQGTILKDQKNLDWASRRDLTSQQFSSAFQTYKSQGYMMIDIDAYQVGSSLRYSMVWRENKDGRKWAEHRDLTSRRYNELWQDYKSKGYRPLDLTTYKKGSQILYAGIWVENKEGLGWSSHRNLSGQEYGAIFQEKSSNGFRLVDMEAYFHNGSVKYSAIWYKNTQNKPWIQLRNLSRSEYQEEVNKKAENGFMVVDFESYDTANGKKYAAIWEKKPGYRHQVLTNRNETSFANLWRQYRDEGYRLVDFERHGNLYSGIWVENSSRLRYSKKSELDTLIKDYRSEHNLPGISVAVIRNGSHLYKRGFGFADIAKNKAAHSETVYLTASVAKAIGGTLAAKLEHEQRLRSGKRFSLDLGNRTDTYINNLPNHHNHTLEELLSHRSCMGHYDLIPNQTNHYSTALAATQNIWDVDLLDDCDIGDDSNYSTPAFTVLAAALEGATGRSIKNLLNNELFSPYDLGIRVQFSSSQLPNNYERAIPYGNNNNPSSYSNNSWKVLGGGMEASPIELSRFGWKLLKGDIMNKTARDDRLWARSSTVNSYGLGWVVRTRDSRRVVEHNGSWTGSRTYLRIYRDNGLVISIMSNSRSGHSGGDISTLTSDIANTILN
ncbi:MAG: serine hydrolase [Pseudobacteriovorax sp.]|nr:serine hydrolase [Pseudobacteriovorax sp.]